MPENNQGCIYLVYLLRPAEPPRQIVLRVDERQLHLYSVDAEHVESFYVEEVSIAQQPNQLIITKKDAGYQIVLHTISANIIYQSAFGLNRADISYTCMSNGQQLYIVVRMGSLYILRQQKLICRYVFSASGSVAREGCYLRIRLLTLEMDLLFVSEVDCHEVGVLLQFGIKAAARYSAVQPVALALKSGSSQGCQTASAYPGRQPASIAVSRALDEDQALHTYELMAESAQAQPIVELPCSPVEEPAYQASVYADSAQTYVAYSPIVTGNEQNQAFVDAQLFSAKEDTSTAADLSAAIKQLTCDFDAKLVATGQKVILSFAFDAGRLVLSVIYGCKLLYGNIEVMDIYVVDQQKRRIVAKIFPLEEQLVFGREFLQFYAAWMVVQAAKRRGVDFGEV